MEFKSYDIEGLVLIKPKLFSDDRGFFMEAYHQRKFAEAGIHAPLFRTTNPIQSSIPCAAYISR